MTQISDNSAVANTELTATLVVQDCRFSPLCVADNRKVNLGGQAPLFRTSSIKDTGKVRLGGQAPIFR